MRESYQRPLLPPGERPIMLHLGTRLVNAVATSNLELFAGVAKKPQHRGALIQLANLEIPTDLQPADQGA